LELTAALVAGLAILAGIAVWQLSAGPISLAFLTPYIERALSPADARFRVKIQDTVLTWAGWRRPVDVRARGVQIYAVGEGAPLATLPQVSIGLSGPALFRGMVAPTSLEIVQPSVHLTWAADGHFELGLSDRPGGDETAIQGVMAGLLAPPDERLPTGYLETVRIRGAQLAIDDERLGLSWVVPSTDITLTRNAAGIRAAISLAVEVEEDRTEFKGELIYALKEQAIDFKAEFRNLQPATYSAATPLLAPLASVRVPLSGSIAVRMTVAGVIESASFNVTGGDGEVFVPALSEPTLPIKRFRSSGRVADGLGVWTFDEVFVDLGGPTVRASGTVTDIGDTLELKGEAELRTFSAEALLRLWPAELAADMREWAAANLTAGTAHQVNLKVTAQAPRDDVSNVSLKWLAATAAYSGVTLRYHDQLPPLVEAAGTVTMLPTRFDFDVRAGRIGGLDVSDGEIHITGVDQPDQDVETRFVARGRLDRLLQILDSPFLDFTDSMGIDPTGADGLVALRLDLAFPLAKNLRLEQVRRNAAAKIVDVSIERGPFGLALSKGELKLHYDASNMEISGDIRMNGIPTRFNWIENRAPDGDFRTRLTVDAVLHDREWTALGAPKADAYMSGPVPVQFLYTDVDRNAQFITLAANLRDARITVPELVWDKAAGVEGAMRMRIELVNDRPVRVSEFQIGAGDLAAKGTGSFNLAGTALERFDFSRLKIGGEDGVDVAMILRQRDDGGYDVNLTGKRFDAEPYLTGNQTLVGFPMSITTDIEEVRFDETRRLGNVVASASFDGERWRTIDMKADLVEEGTDVKLHLKRQAPGEVEIELTGERFNAEPYLASGRGLNLPIASTPGPDSPPVVALLHMTPWAVTANTAAAVAGFRLQLPELSFPMTLRANFGEFRLDQHRKILNMNAAARYDGDIWRVVEMCADLSEGGQVELRYRPEGDIERFSGYDACREFRDGGAIDLSYQPAGRQELIVYSDDAGAALRSLSNAERFKALRGGLLGLIAFADPLGGDDSVHGKMQIRNFRVEDPPMMARLLSVFSIDGIRDLVTSDDMTFKTLVAEFTSTDTRIEVHRVWATSTGVAFYADGYIDFAENYMKVSADVAPFEPLNKLIQLFPGPVSKVLAGVDNKGIVAIPMRIEGPLDAPTFSPEMSLQPIAPGVLRNILEFFETAPKDLSVQTRLKPLGELNDN
jgi:hypothetical protein